MPYWGDLMEKDYSKFREIMVKDDLPFKFISNDFRRDIYSVFEELGIITLEDLFIAYDKGVFNNGRKRFYVEIKGQIELLMTYYMNTPLIGDEALERRVNVKSQDSINDWDVRSKNELKRVGISPAESYMLYDYCSQNGSKMITRPDGTISVLQIMRNFADDDKFQSGIVTTMPERYPREDIIIQNLKFKTELYETYMDHKRYLEKNGRGFRSINGFVDSDLIRDLNKQMKFLIKAKDNIDIQIMELQEQLANIKSVRGKKK